MGNNDNRVVTQRALNSFITSNGGTVVASDSDVALVYSEITSASYAPQYQSDNGVVTSAGIKVSDYTGIGGGAYTANQVVIERDVTWESASRIPTTGISISGPSQVSVGNTITLIATLTPADATDPVVWTIDDTTKATIDQNGVVTGIAEGTVTVTATSNGISATHQVEVTRANNPSSTANVTVTAYHSTAIFKNENPVENPSASEYSIFGSNDEENNYGQTIENFFTYTTGTTKTFYIIPYFGFSYSHLRAEYGTNRNTDMKIFTSDVTVEYIGTWSSRPVYAATFTLNPQIDGEYGIFFDIYTSSAMLDVDNIEVPVGETVQSKYYTQSESQNPEPVSYYIGDTSIATVDSNGVVTGVSEGTTSIQVVGNDYSFGQATVTVTAGSGTGGESGGEQSDGEHIDFYGNGAYWSGYNPAEYTGDISQHSTAISNADHSHHTSTEIRVGTTETFYIWPSDEYSSLSITAEYGSNPSVTMPSLEYSVTTGGTYNEKPYYVLTFTPTAEYNNYWIECNVTPNT